MSTPPVRYATSGLLNIAYQTWGDGPLDLMLLPGFVSHIEYGWEEPSCARFLRSLSTFCRVIAFDKRGMGLSDRQPDGSAPGLEERVQDIKAVMEAANASSPGLLAWSEGGPSAIAFSAEYPELVSSLILIGTSARFSEAPDFPEGAPRIVIDLLVEAMREEWGSGVGLEIYAPSVCDDVRFRQWWARYQRLAATPGAVEASLRMQLDVDVRGLLRGLTVPTLVLHRPADMVVPVTLARYSARSIPGARYEELPGPDHIYWVGDQGRLLRLIREFLASTPEGRRRIDRRARRARHPSEGWESLTEAELAVVRLVEEGLTNREIALRLHVSPRTVQTHVKHVFLKLGLSRRAEIAAGASRRPI